MEDCVKVFSSGGGNALTIEQFGASPSIVEMYSSVGQLLRAFALTNDSTQVDMEGFGTGEFFVHVISKKGRTVKRIWR